MTSAGDGVQDTLAAGLAWQEVEKGATVIDTTTWQLAGSYDFKAAKIFAQYGQVDNDSAGTSVDITGLGVAVPIGGLGKVLLQWGRISPGVGAKRTTTSLGYDYTLSKRSNVYLVFMSDKISGRSTGNNISAGMQHRF
jgi:predicted porin